jgi:prophage antirepressor-like protein
VASRLDDDEKGVHTADTPGGLQQVTIITEPALYAVILQSRKPIARRFDRWDRPRILPSICRSGNYTTHFDGAVVLQQINRRLDTFEKFTKTRRRSPTG